MATKQQTIYLNQSRFNDLVYASRLLVLSKSTIINVLVRDFLGQKKETIKKILDSKDDKYQSYYNMPSIKIRSVWSVNSTFLKGVKKFCEKNNLTISFFIHLVLIRYSWYFMEKYQMSLKNKFNRVYEKKVSEYARYNFQRGIVL